MDELRQILADRSWLVVACGLALTACGSSASDGAAAANGGKTSAAAAAQSGSSALAPSAGATAQAQVPSAGKPALPMSATPTAATPANPASTAARPAQATSMQPAQPGASSAGAPAAPAMQPSAGNAAAAPSGSAMVEIEHPDAKRSAGCGMAAPMAGNASIDVMGQPRDYILALPQGYDPNTPYKLVFAWHGLGGSAQQVASNWYGLSRMAQNTAIFVAGQGLMTMTNVGDGAGWPNTNGQDVAFVKALYAQLQNQLCLDENRVFSVGMSYGGIMSNTLGCQMGDVIRAIAPMSGSGPGFGGRGAMCVGQVAVWMSHGDNDTVVPTSAGEMSRDYWVNANHCQMPGVSVDPSPCVAYTGCDKDSPVTFCEFSGGHTVPPFASAAIWSFFSQF